MGLGVSGQSAVKLALFHKAQVAVLDSGFNNELQGKAEATFNPRGKGFFLIGANPNGMRMSIFFIISPGISMESPLAGLAKYHNCPIFGELEFGSLFIDCPILAVTGTNGKTTTVDLIVHCLSKSGYKAIAAGNIGTPLSEVALKKKKF